MMEYRPLGQFPLAIGANVNTQNNKMQRERRFGIGEYMNKEQLAYFFSEYTVIYFYTVLVVIIQIKSYYPKYVFIEILNTKRKLQNSISSNK